MYQYITLLKQLTRWPSSSLVVDTW
jgi:hypothetical protein